MSKANNAVKVLRTALKRVQKSWTRGYWSNKNSDGTYSVCLEGAIFGYCSEPQTDAQRKAHAACLSVVRDRMGNAWESIPRYNDMEGVTEEDIVEVIKLAIIRLETGWDENDPDGYIDLLSAWKLAGTRMIRMDTSTRKMDTSTRKKLTP